MHQISVFFPEEVDVHSFEVDSEHHCGECCQHLHSSPHSHLLLCHLCVLEIPSPIPYSQSERESSCVSDKCYVGMGGFTLVRSMEMFKWTYVCWTALTVCDTPTLFVICESIIVFVFSMVPPSEISPCKSLSVGLLSLYKSLWIREGSCDSSSQRWGHLFCFFFFTFTKTTFRFFFFLQSIGLIKIRCPMERKQSSENYTHFCVHT